jgi:predicted nucleic acid-binding protein
LSVFVVDASVAAKWLLPAMQEPLVEQANRLLGQETEGSADFVVPDLFWPEIGNVLWKAVRRERITPTQAEESLITALSWAFETVPSRQLLERALEIGLRHQRSFYDSIYVALAVSQQIELITADERLANAVAAHLPVKWLGAI